MLIQDNKNLNRADGVFGNARIAAAVVLQDAGAAANVLKYTIMSQITATGKWVPLTDVAATDGTAIPKAILAEEIDITGADVNSTVWIKANTVLAEFLIFGDENPNSLTLDTTIIISSTEQVTIRQALASVGLDIVNSSPLDTGLEV